MQEHKDQAVRLPLLPTYSQLVVVGLKEGLRYPDGTVALMEPLATFPYYFSATLISFHHGQVSKKSL